MKLKVIEAGDAKKVGSEQGANNGKGKGGTMAETPCKWFRSYTGCKAGRQCKWSHPGMAFLTSPLDAGTACPRSIAKLNVQ